MTGPADPPIVAALVAPLLSLRAALGTGDPIPDPELITAIERAARIATDADIDHGRGLYALESSLETSADAVPTMRTTRSEVATVADAVPAYLTVVRDAHADNAAAATRVDTIIARFRRDAGEVVDTAQAESDADRVLTLGAKAFRAALTEVTGAQDRMDQHTARLRQLTPDPLSTPPGFGPPVVPVVQSTPQVIGTGPTRFGAGPPANPTPNPVPSNGFGVGGTAAPAAPAAVSADPAVQRAAIEAQLQAQLITAGVTLATSIIDAGVELGVKAIDRLADVGVKVVDTMAASAVDVLGKTQHPDAPGTAASGPAPKGQFDFGAPAPPSAPSPAPLPAPPPEPKPAPNPGPPVDRGDKPATPPFSHPSPPAGPLTPGPAAAPPAPPAHTGPPPKRGQLGVTEPVVPPPAAAPVVEPHP